MDLVLDGEYRFLSDDLGIIADDGTFYRSPKRIQIYPYNLEGSPELEHRLLSGRGYIDTLQWRVRKRLKGMKGVRRRVTAEQFFGNENVASQGRVRRFIHLERSFLDAPRLTEVASTEIARRSSHVLVHELNPLHEVGAAANAANLPSRLTTETWRAEAETHLAAALSTVPCFEMRVPMKTTPSELVRLFRTIDG
jgi:hypothetical protein